MVLVWMLNFGRKDTPVLMANNKYNFTGNPFRNNAKALAVAAAMPFVAVPIQEVQLLDYAVAHETVNSSYGLTASVDVADPDRPVLTNAPGSIGNDIYLGLSEDPYTSDQQRERDQYELDDENWNEVVFEEVNGSSTAKLALHNNWINKKGYQVDGVVNLDLPEQGISGLFRITSIKHIIPQKKPVDDDEADEYDYRPVTALFSHESDQVYEISFDNGEELGVTYQHPIFSVTEGDWQFAGELEIGEEVLTKSGNTKVVSSTKKEGSETVYNLEVKELHNFLVGGSGIVVHNNCLSWTAVVGNDWMANGAHCNIPIKKGKAEVEISLRPDNNGGFFMEKSYSSTSNADFETGKELLEIAFQNKKFTDKLISNVEGAIGFFPNRPDLDQQFTALLAALKVKYQ